MTEMTVVKRILMNGTSLTVNITKEVKELGLGRGDVIEIVLRPLMNKDIIYAEGHLKASGNVTDLEAWFDLKDGDGERMRYLWATKDSALRDAKNDGKRIGAKGFYLTYVSGKSVGYWRRKGDRWYKEY